MAERAAARIMAKRTRARTMTEHATFGNVARGVKKFRHLDRVVGEGPRNVQGACSREGAVCQIEISLLSVC